MKKAIAILLALMLVVSLTACGGNGDPTKDPGTSGSAEPTQNQEPVQTTAPPEDLLGYAFTEYGEGKVTIVGTELGEDDFGDPFLRIYYDYTNTAQTAAGQSPYYALNWAATQDGEELYDLTFSYADDTGAVADDLRYDMTVQPGVTIRQTALFYCDPEAGLIDVSCCLMIGSWMYNDEDLVRFEFQVDPADLMGAPKDTYEIRKITAPGYTAGMPASGSSDSAVPFTISLNGYELTTYDDLPALRVLMTYTNDSEDSWPACVAVPILAYQDGVSLMLADAWYLDDATEADEAFEQYVEPGETIDCNAIFLLRGDSAVEVVVEQPLDALRAGMICELD